MPLTPPIDPQLAALFDPFTSPFPLPVTTREEVLERRGTPLGNAEGALGDAVVRTDVVVPAVSPVPVRLHRPKRVEGPLPCVISMHGGGHLFGSYAMDDLRHDRWCPKLGYLGVAVDYRLAFEHPYPAAIDDCYAVLAWVHDNARELGVDPERVGLSGTSAGGGLAAALSLLARDRGEHRVAFQQLIYPMLDDRQITASSGREVPVWPPASNKLAWDCLLGELRGSDDVPPYAAPARAAEFGGLPPTFIGVGTLDLFVDEDIDFAQSLIEAGVETELHVYPGAPHGFDAFAGIAAVATQAVQDQRRWLEAQLRHRIA